MPHTYHLADDVRFTEVTHGGVLLSRRSGQYRQVNPSGTRILRLLVDGEPVDGIVEHLQKRYADVDAAQITRDLHQLLDDLAAEGVLVRV